MKHIRLFSVLLCFAMLFSSLSLISCDFTETQDGEKDTQASSNSENNGDGSSSGDKFSPVQGGDESMPETMSQTTSGTTPEETDKGGENTSDTDGKEDETAKETIPYERNDLFELSQMDFAVSLLKETVKQREDDSSLLISPTSVMIALAMTANGARGETLEDMEEVLGMSIDELNAALKKYIMSLPSSKDAKLNIANSIWIREFEGLRVKDDFLNNVSEYYSATPYLEPFDKTTVDKINQWVDTNTDGMIKKLLDEIDPQEMMHLINAVCFDAVWAEQYPDESVKERRFTNSDGKTVSVPMMWSEDGVYIESADATGFIKRYKGGYSFAAILPRDGVDVYDYISSLDASKLDTLLHNRKYGYALNSAMPKFKYEYSVNMNEILIEMGMNNCFLGQDADFTDMAECDLGPLAIGAVSHKTMIEVDQGGTRAAAVTDVVMYPESAPMQSVSVILNRPFLFMILHEESCLPIFMGAVSNIEGEQVGEMDYIPPVRKEYVRIDFCGEMTEGLASVMEKTSGAPYIRIDSMDELAALSAVLEKDAYWYDLNNREGSMSYRELCGSLDEEYFEKNSLIIPYVVEGSGSTRHRIEAVYIDASSDPGRLVMELTDIHYNEGTSDMAGWFLCIGLPKAELDFGGELEIISRAEYVSEY